MQASNRYGDTFESGETVKMVDSPILYESMKDQELKIDEIKISDTCESGFMILVTHLESGKQFKNFLDTNWFRKLDNK